MSFYLTKLGAEVVAVNNGQEAYEQAMLALHSAQDFELILCDMQMPIMDGYTAVAKLRASGYDLPIVALTAHAMSGDKNKCLEAGCNDYATKPINEQCLIDLLNKYCTLY